MKTQRHPCRILCTAGETNTQDAVSLPGKIDFFWPVLQTTELTSPISFPTFCGKLSLVFTSVPAIAYFAHRYLNFDAFLREKGAVSFVGTTGKTTRDFFLQKYPEIEKKNLSKMLISQEEIGLKPILLHPLLNTLEQNIFIFTSLYGRTEQVITNLKQEQQGQAQYFPIPLYKTEPTEQLCPPDLATDLMKNASEKDFIFICRSGFVVRSAVKNIVKVTNAKSPEFLPPSILFYPMTASAYDALKELKLLSRLFTQIEL